LKITGRFAEVRSAREIFQPLFPAELSDCRWIFEKRCEDWLPEFPVLADAVQFFRWPKAVGNQWLIMGVMTLCHGLFFWSLAHYDSESSSNLSAIGLILGGSGIVPSWILAPACLCRLKIALRDSPPRFRAIHLGSWIALYIAMIAPFTTLLLALGLKSLH
jgi:hypothetical protein